MKSQRFLYHIKRQGNKVATFLKSREVVTFLFFFVLAFFLWYMYNIGTQREISRRIPISYIGVPDNVQLEKELPEELKFEFEKELKNANKRVNEYENKNNKLTDLSGWLIHLDETAKRFSKIKLESGKMLLQYFD